jgi:hypothetical protein
VGKWREKEGEVSGKRRDKKGGKTNIKWKLTAATCG